MLQRWRHRRRCRKLAHACPQPILQSYLESCAGLDIGRIDETPLIAADLELTGMESSSNRIIAIGWTLVDGGRIRIGSNRHMLIHPEDQTVGTSAAYHEILDNEVAEGEPLEAGLEKLFEAARGRVWIFHHAGLDIAFLKKACARWMKPFVWPGLMLQKVTTREPDDGQVAVAMAALQSALEAEAVDIAEETLVELTTEPAGA